MSSIDLSGLASSFFRNIEKIDLGGAGANTLVLDKQAVVAMAGSNGEAFAPNLLLVKGDAGDRVTIRDGWTKGAPVAGTPFGETGSYVTWTNGAAVLLIDEDVLVFTGEIDAATMTGEVGFRIFGADAGDYASTVSSAGDINGDGFDDLIVGAVGADNEAGEAFVVFGTAAGFADIDLSVIDLVATGKGFRIFGDNAGVGASVASAGDINGDGFDDLVIGAHRNGDIPGKAIVLFGRGTPFADIDLSAIDLVASNAGFRIFGADGGDHTGGSVSSAGDINGDGFDDLIVGAFDADGLAEDKDYAGEAIVVFGKGETFADIDLATLDPADGFRIFGADEGDNAGWSVSSAGDINGDGFDDLIIGVPFADGLADGKSSAGEAIVVFGRGTGFADIDVFAIDLVATGTGFRIFGADEFDRAGISVSSAGDINGDGFDDLIVGARYGDGRTVLKPNSGEAIVVFGRETPFADIDVSAIDLVATGTGFRIFGANGFDVAGSSVSSAGDINGDGFDDLIVGTQYADGAAGTDQAGQAIVVFGKANGFADIDLSAPDFVSSGAGFRIFGADEENFAGSSVASAGDIDGDGFDDLIVGAWNAGGAEGDKPAAGEAIVIFGGNLTGSVVFAGTSGADTFTGTSAAETFVGGRGNDAMIGGGGADAFQGGEGDDAITVPDLAFRKVDGGSGTDTLVFSGAGQTIDFTALADNRVEGIEAMDVTGSGDDTIVIGALDMLHFSDTPNAAFTGADSHRNLVVYGETGDTLDLRDFDPDGIGVSAPYLWQLEATGRNLADTAAGGFKLYNLMRDGDVVASVAVDADMNVLLAP